MKHLWRLLFKLSMLTGIIGIWSHIYRNIWERKYKHLELPTINSMEELAAIIGDMVYRGDSFLEFWDAWSLPEAVWGRFQSDEPVGDCDDFALFISNTILKNKEKFPGISDVKIMTIGWTDGYLFNGHNVSLIFWGKKFGVMDYHMPSWFDSLEEAKDFVMSRYAPKKECIGWGLTDCVTLKPVMHRSC